MISVRFKQGCLQGLLVLAILVSQLVSGMDFRVRLVPVDHDGFCFYRAVEKALGESGSGRALFQRLVHYLHTNNISGNNVLEAHLSDAVVGSGINALLQQLDSTPPTLNDRNSWAGMPELVALVHMLGQPVLVWHINQSLQVDDYSLLVTPEGITPVFSIEDDSAVTIPDIQLVHVGNEWSLLEAVDSLEAWGIGWEQYRRQMAGLLQKRLQEQRAEVNVAGINALPQYHSVPLSGSSGAMHASVVSGSATMTERINSPGRAGSRNVAVPPDEYEIDSDVDSDSNVDVDADSYGWVSFAGPSVPRDYLILLGSSLAALKDTILPVNWWSLMEAYIRMKFELSLAVSEADDVVNPGFHWSPGRYSRVAHQIDITSLTLVSQIGIRFIEDSISGYLKFAKVKLSDFVWSLLPARHFVWETLLNLGTVVDSLGGMTLAGYFSFFLASSQSPDVTAMVSGFDLPGTVYGQQHPERIEVTPGRVEIPFDAANILHHILFSLYVSARSFQLASQCLVLSMQLTDQELATLLEVAGGPSIRARMQGQLREFDAALSRIRTVIHGLGHRYYPQYWGPGRYQALSICNVRTIVFHSDDFQPRDGWYHLRRQEP